LPRGVIIRLVGSPAGRVLAEEGRAALLTRTRLEPGTLVSVWVEELGVWVHALVEEAERTSLPVLERWVGASGYGSVEEWARSEERRHKGSLPGWLVVLRAVEEGL